MDALVAQPSPDTLKAARQAWLEARVPYQQTEAYRFGNAIVDDWEGRVNAWPLDEGLIDYVDASYGTEKDDNAYYAVNVIANSKISVGGKTVDASKITPKLLSEYCTKPTATRPTWPPATTRSNSCCGART